MVIRQSASKNALAHGVNDREPIMSKLVRVASLLWRAGVPQIAPFFGVGRGSIKPVRERIDPLLAMPMRLTRHEFDDLISFVGQGLLDRRARPRNLCSLVPESLPSGMRPLVFEGCRR